MIKSHMKMDNREKLLLEKFSAEIRKASLYSTSRVLSGHIGGIMSMIDVIALLYGKILNIDVSKPKWEDRDWLIVSKGHCGPAVYSALALKGYFDRDELLTLNQGGTRLPSHCDMNKTPGIDMTTGSLGQGMSSAIGISWGNRYKKIENYTYLIIGDGECDEGQIWEGALFAAQQKLEHLIVFVDCNKKQLDGYTKNICDLGDLQKKFEAFGWDAQECNGHDFEEMNDAINRAKEKRGFPHMIVLNTIKGKGCSFAEDLYYNHYISFTENDYNQAVRMIDKEIEAIEKCLNK